MASYGVSPQEVAAAIQEQSLEAAPGRFGQSSPEAMEYAMKYKGKLTTPESYENIIVRANADSLLISLHCLPLYWQLVLWLRMSED